MAIEYVYGGGLDSSSVIGGRIDISVAGIISKKIPAASIVSGKIEVQK